MERAGFDVADLRRFLVDNDLALMASRNVTIRDDVDVQQPFNLRVPGGVETIGADGAVYDVAFLQIFQADQLRSLMWTNGDGETKPVQGRRVLAQPLHDPAATAAGTPAPRTAPPGSVAVAFDGSAAAFVPAGRALSWQLTDPHGEPVVRERYWLTFQPGEIRVCGSCHGVNDRDQAGRPKQRGRTDLPAALDDLLRAWASRVPTPGGSMTMFQVSDLRQRIDAARARCGISPVSWTDPTIVPGVTPVKAVHVTQARTALTAAYRACGRTPRAWTDPSLAPGTSIKAVHFTELGDAADTLQ